MRWQAWALILLLATAAALPKASAEVGDEVDEDDDDEFDEERAVLIVRRVLGEKRPLEGKQTTVTISLYNAGNTPATDVKLTEAAWPEGIAVEGELTAAFDSIPSGSSVQHIYKIAAASTGPLEHPGTTVTYMPGEDEPQQTVVGEALQGYAITIIDSLINKALEAGSTVTLGTLNSPSDWKSAGAVVGVVVAAFLGYRSYGSFTEASRKRRRAKALAELEALEKKK